MIEKKESDYTEREIAWDFDDWYFIKNKQEKKND